RINVRKMDVHAVIRSALEAVRPGADAKNVQLVCEMQPGTEEFCGDPDRLQQVIWNLLSNAIKFTPREGRVTMEVSRVLSQLQIAVSDTGVGIAAEALPHVFNRFWQADSSSSRAQGGLGLGLAIVRHLVEVHGGTVAAESEGEGKGARFTVRMPLRAVTPESEAQPPQAGAKVQALEPHGTPAGLLTGVEVLVVDDDADARDLVAAVLVRSGARVRTASSVDEAVERLRERRPDVLLSDIGLPSQDGYELIRRVRALDESLPAAALTAFASP